MTRQGLPGWSLLEQTSCQAGSCQFMQRRQKHKKLDMCVRQPSRPTSPLVQNITTRQCHTHCMLTNPQPSPTASGSVYLWHPAVSKRLQMSWQIN